MTTVFSKTELELLKLAFDVYSEEADRALPTADQLKDICVSPRFERNMQRLLRSAEKRYYPWLNTAGKRVACAAAALLILATGVTFSVASLREPVVRHIAEAYRALAALAVPTEEPAATTASSAATAHTTTEATTTTITTTTTTTTATTTTATTTTTQKSTTTTKPKITGWDLQNPAMTCTVPGDLIGWLAEDETVYAIFEDPNCLFVFDAKTLNTVKLLYLPGHPTEVQLIDGELMISFDVLKRVSVYNTKTFEETRTIEVPYAIGSFCFNGDIMYFTEYDQHCDVYRHNLATGETERAFKSYGTENTFYEPTIRVDDPRQLLYIGESNSTGSKLYCYRINGTSLSLHSSFKATPKFEPYPVPDYGCRNSVRTLLQQGNSILWGCARLSASDVSQVITQYFPANESGGLLAVNDTYAVTTEGIHRLSDNKQVLSIQENDARAILTNSNRLLLLTPDRTLRMIPYR